MTIASHRRALTVESWTAFTHEGVTYDLSHLRAYTATFNREPKPGKQLERYSVNVTFSHHCFTTDLPGDGETYDAALRYDHEGDQRIFNARRWRLSKQLPALIAGMKERKCLQTGHGNFVSINMLDEHGTEVRYEIYFRTWKPGQGRIHLHIESAYVRDSAPPAPVKRGVGASPQKHLTAIAFFTILHNTLNGIPIRN